MIVKYDSWKKQKIPVWDNYTRYLNDKNSYLSLSLKSIHSIISTLLDFIKTKIMYMIKKLINSFHKLESIFKAGSYCTIDNLDDELIIKLSF